MYLHMIINKYDHKNIYTYIYKLKLFKCLKGEAVEENLGFFSQMSFVCFFLNSVCLLFLFTLVEKFKSICVYGQKIYLVIAGSPAYLWWKVSSHSATQFHYHASVRRNFEMLEMANLEKKITEYKWVKVSIFTFYTKIKVQDFHLKQYYSVH